MKLSKRLQQIIALIPQNARVADIGSDHAFVPIELVQQNRINFAIASEVVSGPLNISKENIQNAGLKNQIETRLGDGLQTIQVEDQVDTIIIAGMGGELILHILEQANPELFQDTKLVLEPNNQEKMVRQWLNINGFTIDREQILEEDHHFYEIMVAEKTGLTADFTEADLLFGPILRQNQNMAFLAKWQHRAQVDRKIVAQLQNASEPDKVRVVQLQHRIDLIERTLKS